MATNNKLRAKNGQGSATRQNLKVDRWCLNATYIEGDSSDLSEISFQSLKETLVSSVDLPNRAMFRKNFVNIFLSRVTPRTIMMKCQKKLPNFPREDQWVVPMNLFRLEWVDFSESSMRKCSEGSLGLPAMDGPWQVFP
jgi:hypothetical protein